NEIKNEKIDKVRTSKVKVVQNIVFKGENREVYYINRYFANRQQGIGIMIQYYDENAKLNQRIDAKQLVYENNNWKLIEGYQRFFADSTEHAEKFDSMSLNINVTPDDFSKKQTDPEQMGFFELKRYINKVESWGGNPIKEKVDLLIKISFPFANFIILLFGVPFTLRFRKKGAALGFAQSLLLAFFYYGVIRAGQAFGYNGAISPFTAAFLGNILFLSGGMVLLFLSRQ
ncbi:LptF/LptG family permease, partial [bacterium]|nr:LptF/LptG family permease [bacterium]